MILKYIQQKGIKGSSVNFPSKEKLLPQVQKSAPAIAFQAKGGNKRMQALLAPTIS